MAMHASGRRPVLRLTGWTVAALLAAVGTASAQTTAPARSDTPSKKTTQKQKEAQRAPLVAPGLTIARDADTGALRAPTEAEAAALAPAAPAAPTPVEQFVTPSGAIAAQVPEDMLTYTVVTRNADGTLDSVCLPDQQAAEAAVQKAGKAAQAAPAASVVRNRSALRPAPGAPNE